MLNTFGNVKRPIESYEYMDVDWDDFTISRNTFKIERKSVFQIMLNYLHYIHYKQNFGSGLV